MSKHCVLLAFTIGGVRKTNEYYECKNYVYCIQEQKLLYVETWNKTTVSKELFSKSLSVEEQMEYIRHKINTFQTQVSLQCRKYDYDNDNEIKLTQIPDIELTFTFTNNNKPENVFDCFLYLLKLGTRMDALSDEEARKKRISQLKQVSTEIECMPTRGVRFQEAKEEFNRFQ